MFSLEDNNAYPVNYSRCLAVSDTADRVRRQIHTLEKSILKTNLGITDVPTDIPSEAKYVYLHNNNISTVPSRVLNHLVNCTELDLSYNRISEVKVGMFEGLVSLKRLLLMHNLIDTVEDRSFSPLGACTELVLSENRIQEVRAEMFEGLASLRTLSMRDNRFDRLDAGAFTVQGDNHNETSTPLQSLRYLNLRQNPLNEIGKGTFVGLIHLETLAIVIGNPDGISNDAWHGLNSLKFAHIFDGNLTRLDQEFLKGLESVEDLDFSANDINTIDSGSFCNMAPCKYLDLSNNEIFDVNAEMWEGLSSLEELDLAVNWLTEVRTDMWGNKLENLLELNLMANLIGRVERGAFRFMKNLRVLNLGTNLLVGIRGDMWVGLSSLVSLRLSENGIQRLPPGSLSNLPHLKRLFLSLNNLTTLSLDMLDSSLYPDSGGHPETLEITMYENPLECDARLCWTKDAAREGWLRMVYTYWCENYQQYWEYVDVGCEGRETESEEDSSNIMIRLIN